MAVGNMLRERDVQYTALRDEVTNTWRILDTWSDDLKNLSPDDDIPDDSKAVTIITEGGFIALIKEAARLGILENATFGTGEAEHEAVLLDKDQEIHRLNQQILSLEEDKSSIKRTVSHTEDYELKEKAMDNILKLVSLQDVSNLGSEK